MTLTYTCNVGYTLMGIATRYCQTDGSGWDESDAICSKCAVVFPVDLSSVAILLCLCVCFHIWRLKCTVLLLISPPNGASGGL